MFVHRRSHPQPVYPARTGLDLYPERVNFPGQRISKTLCVSQITYKNAGCALNARRPQIVRSGGSRLRRGDDSEVNQPPTSEPLLSPPEGGLLVTRMANIPHGNSLVAQGIATPFDGPPTLSPGTNPISGGNPAFSVFPSFNTAVLCHLLAGEACPSHSAIFHAASIRANDDVEFSGAFTRQTDCQPASSAAEFRLAACSGCDSAKDLRLSSEHAPRRL